VCILVQYASRQISAQVLYALEKPISFTATEEMKTKADDQVTVLHLTNQSLHNRMAEKEPLPVRIITHNIRYATQSPFKGEEPWAVRRNRVINELRYNTLGSPNSFICLQEVLHNQLVDIEDGLNTSKTPLWSVESKWAYIGVGRDDGHEAGEYSPIFYQPAVWELESSKTVWLSKTPEKPSKSWDAASIRILTVGSFKHRQSKRYVLAMNTHLDDQGSESRYEAAKIILHEMEVQMQMERGSGERPLSVFLTGDLNSEPDQEAYRLLNGTGSYVRDLRDLVLPEDRYGHDDTFTGFGDESERPKRIDFLFLGGKEMRSSSASGHERMEAHWTGLNYSVLENRFDDGVYLSDHRAVVGDGFVV